VRGDLFWGSGSEAEAGAGKMRARGAYYLLLPRAAAARLARSQICGKSPGGNCPKAEPL
jgi:membrane-bound lytic murein transglycosylase A